MQLAMTFGPTLIQEISKRVRTDKPFGFRAESDLSETELQDEVRRSRERIDKLEKDVSKLANACAVLEKRVYIACGIGFVSFIAAALALVVR